MPSKIARRMRDPFELQAVHRRRNSHPSAQRRWLNANAQTAERTPHHPDPALKRFEFKLCLNLNSKRINCGLPIETQIISASVALQCHTYTAPKYKKAAHRIAFQVTSHANAIQIQKSLQQSIAAMVLIPTAMPSETRAAKPSSRLARKRVDRRSHSVRRRAQRRLRESKSSSICLPAYVSRYALGIHFHVN